MQGFHVTAPPRQTQRQRNIKKSGVTERPLLGQPVRLDLQTSHSRTDLRPPDQKRFGGRLFHGHITAFAKLGANGGFARYQLTIEPWLAFLGHNRDNYLFQDKSVIQIVDELFADWAGQGRLIPEWRWHLADSSVYPQRGMTVQYQESDLAFLKRLLAEEGLFCWFEHAKGEDTSLGKHNGDLAITLSSTVLRTGWIPENPVTARFVLTLSVSAAVTSSGPGWRSTRTWVYGPIRNVD